RKRPQRLDQPPDIVPSSRVNHIHVKCQAWRAVHDGRQTANENELHVVAREDLQHSSEISRPGSHAISNPRSGLSLALDGLPRAFRKQNAQNRETCVIALQASASDSPAITSGPHLF